MESTPGGPLAGIRVLEFAIALTGPYATALLADQGAEVVKVERPGIGDIARWVGVAVNGMSAFFLVCNRGKRSIALDLQQPEGVEIARRLATDVDLVIENFRPGVMDRLGLGYEAIRALNRDVVYASLTGFGSEGPYRDRSAYDTAIQAYGGFATNQADPDERAPRVPPPNRRRQGDRVVRLPGDDRGAAGARERRRRSTPRAVDDRRRGVVPLGRLGRQRGAARLRSVDELVVRRRLSTDAVRGRVGHRGAHVRRRFRRDVPARCRSRGSTTRGSATIGERRKHREVMDPIMDMVYAHAANLTQAEATARFEAERVPFSMILSPDELTRDEHAVAIGLFEEHDHHIVGRTRVPRHPTRFRGTPAKLTTHSPALGEHSDAILEELGMADQIDDLRTKGVIA